MGRGLRPTPPAASGTGPRPLPRQGGFAEWERGRLPAGLAAGPGRLRAAAGARVSPPLFVCEGPRAALSRDVTGPCVISAQGH